MLLGNGTDNVDLPDPAGLQNESFRLRSYQAEMVEESLNENIIVAMDTGSGKTHMYTLSYDFFGSFN